MNFKIRDMKPKDFRQAIALWQGSEGVSLSGVDTFEGISRFLKRNPRMSFVVEHRGEVIATILCGHDGLRAAIYHFVVAEQFQGKGLGSRLVKKCLQRISALGLDECRLTVSRGNEKALQFWMQHGWQIRESSHLLEQLEITSSNLHFRAA